MSTSEMRRSVQAGSSKANAWTLYRMRILDGGWTARLAVFLIFVEICLFGGDRPRVAILFSGIAGAALAGLALLTWWGRQALRPRLPLTLIYGLFGCVMLWGAAQFLPIGTGIAKAAWEGVGLAPLATIDTSATFIELLKLFGLGCVFCIGLAIGADDDRAHAALVTVGVLAGLYGLWSVWDFTAHYDGQIAPDGGPMRLAATLLSPNSAACLFAVGAVVAWSGVLRVLTSERWANDLLLDQIKSTVKGATGWFVLMLLMLWALALTGSRGGSGAAFLGLLSATLCMGLGTLGRKRGARFAIMVAAAALPMALVFVMFVLSNGPTAARMTFIDDALANRSAILGIYASQISDVPLNGYGLGTFRHFNSLLAGPGQGWVLWDLGAMHNVFMQWIYEAGPIGAGLMFVLIGAILWTILGGLKRRRFGRTWIAVAIATSVTLLTQGAIDFALQLPAIAALWSLILGVAFSVSRPTSRRAASSSDSSSSK